MSPRTAESTDPNGVDTTTVYDGNDLYPVHIYEASNRSEARSWTLSHQFHTGLLASRTDDDNGVTSGFDYEPLGRPEKVTEAGMRETNTVYDDENLAVLVKADLDTMADGKLTTVRHFDPSVAGAAGADHRWRAADAGEGKRKRWHQGAAAVPHGDWGAVRTGVQSLPGGDVGRRIERTDDGLDADQAGHCRPCSGGEDVRRGGATSAVGLEREQHGRGDHRVQCE